MARTQVDCVRGSLGMVVGHGMFVLLSDVGGSLRNERSYTSNYHREKTR